MCAGVALERRFIIISGLSGAGKTIALHALEDAGYYCVDNLPIGILTSFAAHIAARDLPHFYKVAVGIDARNDPGALADFPASIEALTSEGIDVELAFIDASDETLLNRFSEIRRKHPLSSDTVSLPKAIQRERVLLDTIISLANIRIDTTNTNVHEFRSLMRERVARHPATTLTLQFQSFGFKNGVPREADFVFDVRCLPNPFWDPALRDLSGRDEPVRAFLDGQPSVDAMIADIAVFLETWIPCFEQENRSYLTIAFGCTGGRHRSVYVADRLRGRFEQAGMAAAVLHRDA